MHVLNAPFVIAATIFVVGAFVLPWFVLTPRNVARFAQPMRRVRRLMSPDEANAWALLFGAIFAAILLFDGEPLGYGVAVLYPLVYCALRFLSEAFEMIDSTAIHSRPADREVAV
jgi:uncharacterized membrane protein